LASRQGRIVGPRLRLHENGRAKYFSQIRPSLRRFRNTAAERVVEPWLFDVARLEVSLRREFFYRAFKALRFNGIDGDYAEFGSWGGMTFALAYHEIWERGHPAHLWAFDSFRGLPDPGVDEEHPVWQEGAMATSLEEFHTLCAQRGIPRDRYTVVPGFYEETLAAMSPEDEPRNIALAYVDCDLYSSTRTVLDFLRPRLKHGMIVAFDDYFCWSATQPSGERRAYRDFVTEDTRWEWVPYVQYGWAGQSFVIESPDQEKVGALRR
jgi:O-methyltransferase